MIAALLMMFSGERPAVFTSRLFTENESKPEKIITMEPLGFWHWIPAVKNSALFPRFQTEHLKQKYKSSGLEEKQRRGDIILSG